ncbi:MULTISPECIES: DUF1573 domain-containing protein [Bacteroides]|uniref:DUF1573 domain-containing protein n=1 Tax=Bacteroides TaxID=816 RepID=UPI001CB85D99|nr:MULTISPECIES: DUF1573 domain-containing protein [Bacteroides]
MNLFAVLMGLHSCQKKTNVEITNMVEEWINREIKFDDGYIFTRLGKDSVYSSVPENKYKILIYADSIGCMGCNLRLSQWMEWMTEVDSISENKVSFLFFIHPKDIKDLLLLLCGQKFDVPVCIDRNNSLNKLNHFPSNALLQTFLLDEDNKVLAIGNPMHNSRIKELYMNIILGAEQNLVLEKRKQTKIMVDKRSMDWGAFNWKKQKFCEFRLTNIGQDLLVVDNVITSCGCTTVEYPKAPVQPRGNLILKVKYVAEHPEYFSKTITVYFNGKDSPIQLKISGNAESD